MCIFFVFSFVLRISIPFRLHRGFLHSNCQLFFQFSAGGFFSCSPGTEGHFSLSLFMSFCEYSRPEITQRIVEAFEMWCYRRILRISWTSHITNIEILNGTQKQIEIIKTVKQRKTTYSKHVMRNDSLQLIIVGKIEEKRKPGRKRNS